MTARAHGSKTYTCTYTWGCDLGESEVVVERETCERSVVCVCVCRALLIGSPRLERVAQ